MSTPIEVSGALLRHRFRVTLSSGLEAPGFVYDKARLPGLEIDKGSAVGTGSFWDPNNLAFEDRFDFLQPSALFFSSNRSNITRGLPFLIAGIGDNDDLEISGIDVNVSGTNWTPVIEPGVFFDLDTPCYLYSNNAVEVIVSGDDSFIGIPSVSANYVPVSLASYYVDPWGRVRPYEFFRQKNSFTTYSGEVSLNQTPDSDPPLYEPLFDNIIWDDIDYTNFEFFVDAHGSGLVRNQSITKYIECSKLARVPWSQEYFQLPLVPFVSLQYNILINIYADPVRVVSGSGLVTLSGNVLTDSALVTGSGYVRMSGGIHEDDMIFPIIGNTADFPSSGYLLIDDDNYRQELVYYDGKTSTEFNDVLRGQFGTDPVIHRDGAQIRRYYPNATYLGVVVGNVPDGDYLVNYEALIQNSSAFDIDPITGLLHIPMCSGLERVTADLFYERGLLLCYEPSGQVESLRRPTETNLNPLAHGVDHGIVWASMFPLHPAKIKLSTSRSKSSDGTIGPVYAGNDFLVVNAQVLNQTGAPVPNQEVTLVLENPSNAGFVNAEDPTVELITRVTDGAGIARFVYTPPDTIQGLGYSVPSGHLLYGSGLYFVNEIPIEEVWSETAGYKTLLFSVSDADSYTPYSQVSGILDITADGRFELVTELSGTADDGYTIWKALEPIALLDIAGNVITASGTRVCQIVFPPASVPTDDDIRAYFISVERRVSVGAMIPEANVASESLEVVVGIPRFMTGEFLFGPVDDPETSAFDSLAYLTINPFERRNPTDARQDPRTLGHKFRVRGSQQNLMRHKFYLGISYRDLQTTPDGQNEIRKIHALRHRFIVEIE